ncbi:MAG: sulfotransferase [Anaerolineales bacterium]|nr:sulfotransferase [Anaerolineales bacterium]
MSDLPGFPASPPLIVLGMHRSGTTLFTRILSDLGVFVGPEVSANFEDVNFQNINRKLLATAGAHWANPAPFVARLSDPQFVEKTAHLAATLLADYAPQYALAPDRLWGWKDPRNTLTLPVWLHLFPEARVVHIIRNGIEVSLSLQRRELRRFFRLKTADRRMVPPTLSRAFRLWETYVQTGMSWQPQCPYWWQTHFRALRAAPLQQLETAAQTLHIPLPAEKFAQATAQIRDATHATPREKWWTRLLWNTHRLDHRLMTEFGYTLPFDEA